MATFRTHISFGIAFGILGALALASLAIADAPSFLMTVFALAALGSVLPDMDSDSSVPFHVAFGSLTIVAVSLVFVSVYKQDPHNWQNIILWSGGVGVLLWAGVGYIFKKFTHHRGIVHSIPAALLAGLLTFFIAIRFGYPDSESFLLALAIVIGFVIHLVLDEVWAVVNFHGKLFIPNNAFGSALKFKVDNKLINIAIYMAIILLLSGNTGRLWNLSQAFWKSVS